MIDVFVILLLSTLVRINQLASIYPAMGSLLFAFMVILSMMATSRFDPRLIWDHTKNELKNELKET